MKEKESKITVPCEICSKREVCKYKDELEQKAIAIFANIQLVDDLIEDVKVSCKHYSYNLKQITELFGVPICETDRFPEPWPYTNRCSK